MIPSTKEMDFEIGDWVVFKPEHRDYEIKHGFPPGVIWKVTSTFYNCNKHGVYLADASGSEFKTGAYCYRLKPHFMTLVRRAAHGKTTL